MAEQSTDEQIFPYGHVIHSINIKKWDTDTTMQVFPSPWTDLETAEAEDIFGTFTITSSLFTPGLVGRLKFKDPGLLGEKFSFSGTEFVDFDIENPRIPDSRKNVRLCVEDVRHIGDIAEDVLGGSTRKSGSGWELVLMSCEAYMLQWNDSEYHDEGFLGKIASSEIWEPTGRLGVVNELANKHFNPNVKMYSTASKEMDIEDTTNTVWVKQNHNMYPWGKDVPPPNLIQMMSNLSENAITSDGSSVNYTFYQDIDGWNFKSIKKMIRDSYENRTEVPEFEGIQGERVYVISDDGVSEDRWFDMTGGGDPRILTIQSVNEWNHIASWSAGAYSAYYELIRPNYEDPYFDYLDFTTNHTANPSWWEGIDIFDWFGSDTEFGDRDIISYDYFEDISVGYSSGDSVEDYRLLPNELKTYTKIEGNKSSEISPRARRFNVNPIYGYFDSAFNNPHKHDNDFLGSIYTEGRTGTENDIMWQTMNDITTLKASTLWKIQNEIKNPNKEAIKTYIEKSNLKEKWNVYRHSICCDRDIEKNTFFAVIDDAKMIQDNDRGGIYQYGFREVEIWPRDDVDDENTLGELISPPDAPVKVVTVPCGYEGDSEGTSAAFNINELFNSQEGDDIFVGPGVNVADEDFNDYPEAFQMMPIGGYFKIGENPCIMEDGADVYYHKHVVQMYKVPPTYLESIAPYGEREEIFLFDVPNSHDGLCDCPSTTQAPTTTTEAPEEPPPDDDL